ncbi:unnamed protein product, partial [Ixodes hexagonus]
METTADTSSSICPSWLPMNHIYFQIANIFFLLSYLAPSGPYCLLYLRGVIGVGSFFFALWGYVILCAFDMLMWYALFTLINLVHGCLAVEKVTPNDNLSLVVSGKLLWSENGRHVLHVGQYEFVESPEWFDYPEIDVHQAT